jgi:hypothetical protein
LELVELEYSSFISKVEKYNKPNLLVAVKGVAVVDSNPLSESANYSSSSQHSVQEPERNWKPYRRNCYACDSTQHMLRDCPRRQEYFDRRQEDDQQHAAVARRRPESRPESPKLKSILRRKSGDNGSNKAKHAKHFVTADEGEYSD